MHCMYAHGHVHEYFIYYMHVLHVLYMHCSHTQYLHGLVLGEDPDIIAGAPGGIADHIGHQKDHITHLTGLQTDGHRASTTG